MKTSLWRIMPMKRVAKFVLLLLVLYLSSPLSCVLGETTTQKLTESIYVLTDKDFYMNSTLILGKEACILVDTRQNLSTAKELKKAVRSITKKPIKYLINTHYHGDHTFGNQLFTEAEIIGHKNVRTTLLAIGEQHKKFFRDYFKVAGTEEVVITPPTLTYEDEMSLYFDGKVINILHPGRAHTEGDSFIYLPGEKLLITGDLLFNRILPFSGDPQCHIGGWINALQRMEGLDIDTVISGHGPIGNKNDLSALRQYLEKLMAEVKQEVEKGKTLEEVKQSVKLEGYKDWDHYDWKLGVNIETAYKELSQKR
jgi:cyclase